MPLSLSHSYPTLVIRKGAFERSGITREAIDERLGLTPDEFQVEGELIAIGPILEDTALQDLIAELEETGLAYFDDFFELTGNWPDWLRLFALGKRA
ncbi:MAG: hypothetical protein ABIT38_04140 [Gemmatimonadaceae bacterium]